MSLKVNKQKKNSVHSSHYQCLSMYIRDIEISFIYIPNIRKTRRPNLDERPRLQKEKEPNKESKSY